MPRPVEELLSLATSADGSGDRLVWLVRSGDDGPNIFQADLHETSGLVEFDSMRLSLRRLRSMRRDLLALHEIPCAEIPTDYARWLIEEA